MRVFFTIRRIEITIELWLNYKQLFKWGFATSFTSSATAVLWQAALLTDKYRVFDNRRRRDIFCDYLLLLPANNVSRCQMFYGLKKFAKSIAVNLPLLFVVRLSESLTRRKKKETCEVKCIQAWDSSDCLCQKKPFLFKQADQTDLPTHKIFLYLVLSASTWRVRSPKLHYLTKNLLRRTSNKTVFIQE